MANGSIHNVALMSIHPQHAFAILRGEKTVEFRKRSFRRPVEHVLLYATAPVRRLVGYFTIAEVEEASPTAIWDRHGRRGAISRSCFREYYRGTKTAVAIVVDEPIAFDRPRPLTDLLPGGYTPQSFLYLCPGERSVLAEMLVRSCP